MQYSYWQCTCACAKGKAGMHYHSFIVQCSCCQCVFVRRKSSRCQLSLMVQYISSQCVCSFTQRNASTTFVHSAIMFLEMHLCFPLRCNVVVGDGLSLVISFTIEGNIVRVKFPSWCNVVFGKHLSLCYMES